MNYGYGQRSSPYGDRTIAPAQSYDEMGYGSPSPNYGSPAMGRDDYVGQNVEMAPLAQNGSQFGQQANPNAILNACTDVNRQMAKINETIASLQSLQKSSLDAVSDMQQKRARKQIDDLSSEIMSLFRKVTGDVKAIKQQPEASSPKNAAQVERLNREIIKVRRNYEVSDMNYRKELEAQIARQVKIVHPDATDQEIKAAVEDPNSQIFSQALMQSDRQGQAQSTRNNVRQRHEEIQKIESQMIELAALFEDMNNLVIQQEEAVINIETKGEDVMQNMDKGTEELGVAVESAKRARKWKWWCLGISVLIVVVIAIIFVVYKFLITPPAQIVQQQQQPSAARLAKRLYVPNSSEADTKTVLLARAQTPRLESRYFRH